MQVAITCRHGDLREETQAYIAQKAEKLLTYFERVTAIEVTVDLEQDHTELEILVNTEHKHNFVSRVSGGEVRATFDRALHKMEQQIKKYKEKIQDHRRDRPLNEVTSLEPGETEPGESESDETEPDE